MSKRDAGREERITMEIIVDCHDEEERSMGWYSYLEDHLSFPFDAACIAQRETSPLGKDEKVRVIGMAAEDTCRSEMFVRIEWSGRHLAVPLAQLRPLGVTAEESEAVADWHYWVRQGYQC